jgi:serine/threonine protein kinase
MPNLPKYPINSALHEGIQTIIYQTQMPKTQQRVILKLLKNEYPTLEAFTRLKSEYQIQLGLDHPNIVNYYTVSPPLNCTQSVAGYKVGGDELTNFTD